MRQAVTTICLVLWLAAIAAGMRTLMAYEATPGVPARSGETAWPQGAAFRPAAGRPTLVVFAHPRCPCTRATIAELDSLMARLRGRLDVVVLFYRPARFPRVWEHTDLWRSAAAIPGVSVATDVDGVEARRFGAATSGQALLYDAAGRVAFRGGITPVRGEPGENAGSRAIAQVVEGARTGPAVAPVFGCAILEAPGPGSRRAASR
ncbi:MAG TPA: hypothetical protein VKT77_07830 [Chthonomonadaceae bacterium]|nr:hypothetical protein [Chthonomonadaceae bacterium]